MSALEIDHVKVHVGDILTTRDGDPIAIVDHVSHWPSGTTRAYVLNYVTGKRTHARDSHTTFFVDAENRAAPKVDWDGNNVPDYDTTDRLTD